MHGERLQVHVGRDADHAREVRRRRSPKRAVVGILRRPLIDDARVRGQGQQPVAQLALEPVHDREHHDQRRHAQGHAGERHPGDEGDEERVLAGAHVAQAHEQ